MVWGGGAAQAEVARVQVLNAELTAAWSDSQSPLMLVGGEEGRLLRSEDAGASWMPVSMPAPIGRLRLFAGQAQGVLLALGEAGVLRSEDGGENWQAATLPAGRHLAAVAKLGERWLAASAEGLLESHDEGRSWMPESGPLVAQPLQALVRAGEQVVAGGTRGQLFVSRKEGGWLRLQAATGASIARLLVLPGKQPVVLAFWSDASLSRIEPQRGRLEALGRVGKVLPTAVLAGSRPEQVFMGNQIGEVWRSGDGGRHWQPSTVVEKIFISALYADPRGGALTAVGGRGTVARSEDGGARWRVLQGEARTSRLLGLAVSADGETLFAVGTGGLVLRGTARGTRWETLGLDLRRFVYDLAEAGDGAVLAAGADGLLLRSTNAGASWSTVASDAPTPVSLLALAPVGNEIFACGPMATLLRSADGGRSWQARQPVAAAGEGYLRQIVSAPDSSTLLLVGGPGVLLRSSDGGRAWTQVNGAGEQGFEQAAALGDDTFLAVALDGLLLRSGDDGRTWRAQLGVARMGGVFADPPRALAFAWGPGGWLRSADRGESWQLLPLPTGHNLTAMLRSAGGSLLAVGSGGLILRSEDDGRNWQTVSSGLAASLRAPHQVGGRIAVPGREGSLLYSDDDGRSWRRVVLPTRAHLSRVWLSPDARVLLAVGERLVRVELGAPGSP